MIDKIKKIEVGKIAIDQMEFFLNFNPLIKNSFYQTFFGSWIDFEANIPSTTYYVTLADGDKIAVEITTPPNWKEDHFSIVMLHGLCGSHKSHYIKRLARKFFHMGLRSIRVNFRGCGSGKGLARGIYHSGCSGDVQAVLENMKTIYPKSPMLLMGFSLGANVALKLGGELGARGKEFLQGIIAVSPPADLINSAKRFLLPENRLYERYFLRMLLHGVRHLHQKFQDVPMPNALPPNMNIGDFDDLYVAPRTNFPSALDYYRECSSKYLIHKIKVSTKILFSEDDPLISSTSLDHLILPSNIHIYKTKFGGHIGYIGQNIFRDFRWMDNQVIGWVESSIRSYRNGAR